MNSGLTLIHNPFLPVLLKWSGECELGFEVIKGRVILQWVLTISMRN